MQQSRGCTRPRRRGATPPRDTHHAHAVGQRELRRAQQRQRPLRDDGARRWLARENGLGDIVLRRGCIYCVSSREHGGVRGQAVQSRRVTEQRRVRGAPAPTGRSRPPPRPRRRARRSPQSPRRCGGACRRRGGGESTGWCSLRNRRVAVVPPVRGGGARMQVSTRWTQDARFRSSCHRVIAPHSTRKPPHAAPHPTPPSLPVLHGLEHRRI